MEKTKTEITIGSDYMEFVYKFHKTMVDQQISMVYEGDITQSLTNSFTSIAEKKMDSIEENTTVKMRVYHVMVECLQNICKHADKAPDSETGNAGSGIFIISQDVEKYTITTGNVINNKSVPVITDLLNQINDYSLEELKEIYKKKMKENRLSEKGGAGLGFIDMAKKTKNKLEFHFEKLSDGQSFFILRITITKF